MSGPKEPVLSVEGLCKSYGPLRAVDGVSFQVRPGEIVGLVGPNGAGKTTTINMVLGVLAPSAGRIEIAGVDLRSRRSQALGCTNFAAVYAPLPGNLTVAQNLRIFGLIYGVASLSQRIETVLETYELKPFRKTKTGVLSSGEQIALPEHDGGDAGRLHQDAALPSCSVWWATATNRSSSVAAPCSRVRVLGSP